ncbi:hypothetical protein CEXT_108771 [Caerostris extrusa]|uniref:Uncharacterized protein n=1 Tax=Caerostris extrusa TaxID=172846 RepID=A0AAV4PAC8_CAEEX|nr:hypothetical protein CEXT_108771 [Caerostris extrusa]
MCYSYLDSYTGLPGHKVRGMLYRSQFRENASDFAEVDSREPPSSELPRNLRIISRWNGKWLQRHNGDLMESTPILHPNL